MTKNKLAKFADNQTFSHVYQPIVKDLLVADDARKGKWHEILGNRHPIVLEIGCGKGEYTTGLAKTYPEKNFIGIDIKGARIWKGAKLVHEEQLKNVHFVRTYVEHITRLFAPNEVSEIWITFPDPQKKKSRKRLTGARFLNRYKHILQESGKIHLKTDSMTLFDFTVKEVNYNNLQVNLCTDNLYDSLIQNQVPNIQTFYERQYLAENKPIKYIQFFLEKSKEYQSQPTEE